ncbi:helicase [Catopsilia pomona nucleopolyhedrovirus]|uniref:Helicase n=1 Tax=Catopsilia pomona nucleopolyhedrovirus TaxID=1850906 RepID=A0A172WZB9_9ABAC|nr:helicase [Catopsilia pomona nucleopolyhedrovirus]ANF29698.1 helicase [Catopsilia pomona nucleopolyhedrovirus]
MDNILQFLFKDVPQDKTYEINNLQDANRLIVRNTRTGARKLLEFANNFNQLLNTITNNFNGLCVKHQNDNLSSYAEDYDDDDNNNNADNGNGNNIDCGKTATVAASAVSTTCLLNGHDWVLESNDFCIYIKPFILKKHYDAIKNYIDFDNFFKSNVPGYTNKCVQSGDYYYWPNWPAKQAFSFNGWRLYLNMKFGIVVEPTIPIIHNNRLGPVNLFVTDPECFLNVELCLRTNEETPRTLFVNGKSKFNDANDDLFIIKMADGTMATCKVLDELTNSDKNFFDYIRDDINLEECITVPKYKHIVNVNLKSLRTFENCNFDTDDVDMVEGHIKKPNVVPIISASSENADFIQNEINLALIKINESMIKVIANNDRADDANIVQKYLEESKFKNFDYLLFVVWKMLIKHENFAYRETDIKLFFELLCEFIFGADKDSLSIALNKCEPYMKLNKTVFNRICNHWYNFDDINPCVALGYYFGIHYLIYLKLSSGNDTLDHDEMWAYTYENVVACEPPSDIMCKGFFRKLENVVTGVNLVFNGKHYQIVKKEDDLFKLTKGNCYKLSNVKFNNWKYLYLTTHGVYNVFTNSFHSSCPFLLGTTLPHPFKKPNDEKYLPEDVFNFMLTTGAEEMNIYRIYHIAKMCRDVKMLKTNLAIVYYLGNCTACQTDTRIKLNNLFRDLWNLNDEDLVTLALYLRKNKVSDILHNFKCNLCRSSVERTRAKCKCFKKIKVNRKALKICLMVDLFNNDMDLSELMWLLIFNNTKLYLSTALIRTHSEFVNEHAKFFAKEHNKIINCMYRLFHKIEYVDMLMDKFVNKQKFLLELRKNITAEPDNDQHVNKNDNGDVNNICNFYIHHANTLIILKKYNIWWDKIILAREKDDLSTWLTRFYMRIILSKMDLKNYSYNYLKKIVEGYLYFKRFTNFNHANSIMMMHYAASLAIPVDYGKKAVYLPGEPGSGKSSFFELLDYLVLMHKFDDDNHNGESNKETSDKEVTKLNSQLYTINELKMCSESYFKKHADSSKSDSKSRKYQGLLKYEANYKMLIVNNNPLYVDDYDDGVQDRFLIVFTNHKFTDNVKFEGSVYHHIKLRQFPLESVYYESLITPVRLFLSHVLMYKRDPKNGFVLYKTLLNNDPIHKHNLMCLSINNSPLYALIYILNIKTSKSSTLTVCEDKMEEMIGIAVPHLKTFLHPSFSQYNAKKNINASNTKSFVFNEQILLQQLKNKFKNNFNETTNVFYNITMALNRNDINCNVPRFKC